MSELILCGRGGQGIVFLTKLMGQILTAGGRDVVSSETHGMAVRGGSINSHLRIGSYSSPLIRQGHADFLVSLDETETDNNRHLLKPNGIVIENSTLDDEPNVLRTDAGARAKALGRKQLENVVILGYCTTIDGFPVGTEEVIRQLSKDPRERVRDLNLKAFESGVTAGRRTS
jgi:indolepyruvate ferredoxin oxidoreductase, beta subunit